MENQRTMKSATVRARIEPQLKQDVEHLFQDLGLTTTEAINIFYKQVKLRHGLPFPVTVPNKTTEKVFKDTDSGKNIVRCKNTDEMFKELDI
jgi:DNA-damage-inducible protein J